MNFLVKNCTSFAEKNISKNFSKNAILSQESKIVVQNLTANNYINSQTYLLSKASQQLKSSTNPIPITGFKNMSFNKSSANKLFAPSNQPLENQVKNKQFQKMIGSKFSQQTGSKNPWQKIASSALAFKFIKDNATKVMANSQIQEKMTHAILDQQTKLFNKSQTNNFSLQYSQGNASNVTKVNYDKTYRDKVLGLYKTHIFPTKPQMENHVLATEAIMGNLFDVLKQNGQQISESKDEWIAAGLLHDVDHMHDTAHDTSTNCKIQDFVKEAGISVSESMYYTISSHEGKSEPKTIMNWALYLSDDISWYILFNASQRSDKSLYNVNPTEIAQLIRDIVSGVKNVPEKAPKQFINRQKIKLPQMINCKDKIGIDFDTFVKTSIIAMQQLQGRISL